MPLRYILISGSPRKGNTDYVLSEIHKDLNGKKELILLRDIELNHCRGCFSCHKTGKCVINDDMSKLHKKLVNTDVIIMVSPNYYGNVSGLLKNFIDRTLPSYKAKSLKNKKLISIMMGGDKIQLTRRFHKEAIKGFVKYNELDLVGFYCFEVYDANDLKQDPESETLISNIVNKINSL